MRQILEQFQQDLTYSLRTLRRSPAFAAVAVLSLALGIGANTAIFTVLNAIVLRMLPVKAPGELVVLQNRNLSFSYPLFRELRDHSQSFDGLAAFHTRSMGLSDDIGTERVTVAVISGTYFDTLGVQTALGSLITPDDDRVPEAGGPRGPVVVLSHAFWTRRFAGSRSITGGKLLLNGHPFTIVGVAAEGFTGTEIGQAADVFAPLMNQSALMGENFKALEARRSVWLRLIGRLRHGVTVAQGEAELTVWLRRFNEVDAPGVADPERRRRLLNEKITLLPGGAGISGLRRQFSSFLMVLGGVVMFVLLIACTNVATLLLSRATGRRREIAIRLAIGAGRGRLIFQLFNESVLLSVLGGALGLLSARWIRDLVLQFVPRGQDLDVSLDFRVLGFTLLISLVAAVIFGIVPALQTTRPAVVPELKGGSAANGGRRFGLQKVFISVQVAFSALLLMGAVLFVRTLINLRQVDTGLTREKVVMLTVEPRMAGYNAAATKAFYERLVDRVRELPQVHSAAMADFHPLANNTGADVFVSGYPPRADEPRNSPGWSAVTPGYFQTMGIPLLAGRDFTARDRATSPNVAIVNETFARYFLGGRNPVGAFIGQTRNVFDVEIVGMVKDSKYTGLREEPQRMVYYPLTQRLFGSMVLHVRGWGDGPQLMEALRQQVRAFDRNVPIYDVHTLEEDIDRSLNQERLMASFCGLFSLLALMLAAIGLNGVMAYAVGQRTREIGIRMAIGASRTGILASVLREAVAPVLAGFAAAAPLVYGFSRFVAGMLYGVGPADFGSMAIAAGLLLTVALASAWIPARRASRIDPLVALRYE